jgi:hypothetical protein
MTSAIMQEQPPGIGVKAGDLGRHRLACRPRAPRRFAPLDRFLGTPRERTHHEEEEQTS